MSIVKMKRLRLIGMQAERESLLRLLQHMGCVEIDEPPHLGDDPEWAALTRPDPGALHAARDARSRVEGALRTLKKYGPKQKGGLLKPRPVVTEEELFDDAAYEAGLADAGRLGELERRITALYAEQNNACNDNEHEYDRQYRRNRTFVPHSRADATPVPTPVCLDMENSGNKE